MKNEGLNLFYKLIGCGSLLCMQRFKSTRAVELLNAIKGTSMIFESRLTQLSDNTLCLDLDFLKRHRLIKKKHYVYGAYLAALNSYPILGWSEATDKIIACIFAKTSAITCIKVLDNLNDYWHSKRQALASLSRVLKTFIGEDFYLNEDKGFISKAENSVNNMARLTYETLRKHVNTKSHTFKLYIEDFARLRSGQVDSLEMMTSNPERYELNIGRYLKAINEKGVGRVWVDIDLCFYEMFLGSLDGEERDVIDHIRLAFDYLFKASNIYDDVADLNEDLRNNIINSVGLLAVDQGYCTMDELLMSEESVEKLKRSHAITDTLSLADLVLLKGLEHLYKVKTLSDHVDVEALIFSTHISKIFCLRKWLLMDKSIMGLRASLKSFQNFKTYNIPEHIIQYEKFI